MFRRMKAGGPELRFRFDGVEIAARQGDTVAAALLAAGVKVTGSNPSTGASRGPYCMMGACYDCLVEIDGIAVQSCQVMVAEGLDVRSRPPVGAEGR